MALTRRASGRPGADPGASPYLHELRRRLSSFGSSQKTRRRLTTQPSGPATEKSSSICSSVQLALQEPLATVHLEVTDRYWYRSVKQEKQGKIRWEVKMCQICCRKSTVEALLKCGDAALEAAVKSRDVTNPFSGSSVRKSELPLQLVKYFQVTIVSDKFQRKSQNERLEMIYRLLLDAAPNSANAQEDTETKPAYQQSVCYG
ncbi:BolA protein [Phytophthora cactorum]|nr:BolA protein [Phytophthora cactorum]